MLLTTSIIAAILTTIFLKLSFAVIALRRKHQVSLGDGGIEPLDWAIRAQGNFSEYAPFAMILLACLEINGAPWQAVAILGTAFISSRLFHAKGLNATSPSMRTRILGMQLTFLSLIALAALNIVLVLFKLLE